MEVFHGSVYVVYLTNAYPPEILVSVLDPLFAYDDICLSVQSSGSQCIFAGCLLLLLESLGCCVYRSCCCRNVYCNGNSCYNGSLSGSLGRCFCRCLGRRLNLVSLELNCVYRNCLSLDVLRLPRSKPALLSAALPMNRYLHLPIQL